MRGRRHCSASHAALRKAMLTSLTTSAGAGQPGVRGGGWQAREKPWEGLTWWCPRGSPQRGSPGGADESV